jgi:hypothetical protein
VVSEIRELFLAIVGAITRLFKLSMVIRNPTPKDRYAKIAAIKPYDPSYDIGHVWEKFPVARTRPWLIERLGMANARRRDFLRYRKKHRERLGREVEDQPSIHKQDEPRKQVEQQDNTARSQMTRSQQTGSSLGQTKASTYVGSSEKIEDSETLSDTGRSETSYATSVDEDDVNILCIPPPPKPFDGRLPFECPYCYTIQSPRSKNAWKYVRSYI